MSQSNDLNEAFRSLATLAIELARFVMAPTTSLLALDVTPVREAMDDVIGWRALLAQDRATRRPELGACASSGEAARTAVEATKRRYEAMRGYEALEADDSRVTDGHKCCGGKPDCGCGVR